MATRAVKTSCKNTKVRSASGSCVKERPSMKKGGQTAKLAEAPVMLMKKGGNRSLSKAQDGGPWQKSIKSIKNTEWQNHKPKPFTHGPQEVEDYKPKVTPKTNWVQPPSSVTSKETDPRKRPDMKKGGSTDKKWIQKAINPAHKGYCTPMTKPTCTPKRKALAITLKKMAKNR